MKFLNNERQEIATSNLRLNEEQQVIADVCLGEGLIFETFPVALRMQSVADGLEVAIDIPNSGLDPFYMVLEYSDIKTLRAIPGKGLISFGLKAFR